MSSVRFADKYDIEEWNNFVINNTSDAFFSFYRLYEWRNILVKSYQYKPFYLVAEKENKFMGCFALMYVKSMLFGNRLISIPFADHGCGPCVKDYNIGTLSILNNKAKEIAYKLNVDSINICSSEPWITNFLLRSGYEKVYDYCTVIIDVNKRPEIIWENLKKRTRNAIRKAEKGGIQISLIDNPDKMNNIYKIHVDNMMRLGTPPHSKSFFETMMSELARKNLIKFMIAHYEDKIIAAISIFPHREGIRWGQGIQLTKYMSFDPMYLLLWKAIIWANENGYKTFDLGGTRPNSGNFFFKTGWISDNSSNDHVVSLDHLSLFLKSSRNVVDVRESKYKNLSYLWRNLMPESLSERIGPWIRKQIAM